MKYTLCVENLEYDVTIARAVSPVGHPDTSMTDDQELGYTKTLSVILISLLSLANGLTIFVIFDERMHELLLVTTDLLPQLRDFCGDIHVKLCV